MKIDVKVEGEFLAAIVQRSGVVEFEVAELLQSEYFQIDVYRWLVELLQKREWDPPVWDYMEQELLAVEDDETRQKYRNQLWSLYSRRLTFEKDASEKFRAYIAFCVVNSKTRSAFEGFNRSSRVDYLLDELESGIVTARQVVSPDKLSFMDYVDNYQKRMLHRKELRDNPTINPRLLTGFRGLDSQFIIKAPMLVDFIAPFKRYKSIFLNAMGYVLLLQGFNVLHVTYENSEELTMDRYDAMFSELNYDRISNLLITQDEKDAIDETFAWMQQWSNRLKIVKAIPEQTTVKDVSQRIEYYYIKDGWRPHVEVWDYLNIIAPSKSYKEERREQKQIAWDLKRHAEAWNVAIFEASQSNMGGAIAERIGLDHRGMSIDISRALDLSIAINQTEKEKEEGIIVLSPQFIRGGEITTPEVVLDSDLPRMSISRELHRLWNHAVKINPVQ